MSRLLRGREEGQLQEEGIGRCREEAGSRMRALVTVFRAWKGWDTAAASVGVGEGSP